MNWVYLFITNMWLWSMTWGMYHAPLTMISMGLLFFFYADKKLVTSILFSFIANALSFIVINGLFGFLLYYAALEPEPAGSINFYTSGYASLYLAILYGITQVLFFLFVSRWHTMSWLRTIIVILLSNTLSAVIIYKCAPQFFVI